MEIDRRYCFCCDRWLGESAGDERALPLCSECRSDEDVVVAAIEEAASGPPAYRGAIPLGVALRGWPTEVVLLALEVWDCFMELSLVERPGTAVGAVNPRLRATSHTLGEMPPRKWVVTTDVGSTHHGGGGSGGTRGTDRILAWTVTLAPALPEDASRVELRAIAPGAEGTAGVDVAGRRRPARAAAVSAGPPPTRAPACPSCGPPPTRPEPEPDVIRLDWAIPEPPPRSPGPPPDERPLCHACRTMMTSVLAAKRPTSAQPDRVIALSADLGEALGTRLTIPTLIAWPTWFDLTLTGCAIGTWGELLLSHRRALIWEAHDDHGHAYHGVRVGGSGRHGLHSLNLSFTPALDPSASTLTITVPPSVDHTDTRATLQLSDTDQARSAIGSGT